MTADGTDLIAPRRVAVATDGSDGAVRAVAWARDLAERSGASLTVIQVLDADEEHRVGERSEALRSSLGGGATVEVRCGDDVAACLVSAAEDLGVDLLVVGNSGMRGRTEFLLGNVANRVTHQARCSVLVVNSNELADHSAATDESSSNGARAREIAATLGGLVVDWRRSSRSSGDGPTDGPRLLREALERLGPTFGKLGQMLSTRPDLIPPEYVAELEQLQSSVPPMDESAVVRVMEAELGVPWEDVFADIDPEPLAAGTIGQVHRARLADGTAVVVKVQREGIAGIIQNDLALLEQAGRALHRSQRVRRVVDLPAALGTLGASLTAELDFRLEAANLDRMADVLEAFPLLAVPRCHHELSTARLLVMDEVPGVPISEVPDDADGTEAARQLLQSFFAQILEHGFFHADPHPGNLLWDNGTIWMIDLGMVGVLDDEARGRLVLLMLALARRETATIVELTVPSGSSVDPAALHAYTAGLDELLGDVQGRSMAELDMAEVLDRMTRLSATHGVALPTELMMVGKALGQTQMTVAALAPDVDPVQEASRFVIRSLSSRVVRRFDPQQIAFEVERFHLRLRQLSDTVGALSGSRPGQSLELGFRSASVERSIQRAGRTIGLGLSAGLAWIAAGSAESAGRRRALTGVAIGLTAAFGTEIVSSTTGGDRR